MRALLASVWLAAVMGAAGAERIRPLLEEANQRFARWDVAQAEGLFRRAWLEGEGTPDERVEAGVAYAHTLWRLRSQFGPARKVLEAARALKAKPAMPWIESADLETSAGRYSVACDAARAALLLIRNSKENRDARAHFGEAVRAELFESALRRGRPVTNAAYFARVRQAVNLLDPVVQNEPGWLAPSRCQVLLALLAGEGSNALRAWHSYFLLVPGEASAKPHFENPRDLGELAFENGQWINRPVVFLEPEAILEKLLPGFTCDSVDLRIKVVRALAGGRLYPEAATLALVWGLQGDKTIDDIIIYGRWHERLSRRLENEYRRHSQGKSYWHHVHIPGVLDWDLGRTSRVERLFRSELRQLWRERHPGPKPPPYPADDSAIDLRISFGVVSRSAEAPDTFSFGHIIMSSDESIEQYGRKQSMHCLILDSFICNGYGDWLMGFTGAGVSGWAGPPAEFAEVHVDYPSAIFEILSDPVLYRESISERLPVLEAEDEQRGKTNPCGYFPGLSLRLFARGNERLLQRLKAQGLTGFELRTAFLRERQRLLRAAIILAHEGRHVFDINDKPDGYSGAELEFRAKCSEVVFAPDPLLVAGLGHIFCPNIGREDNSHGSANTHIMKLLVDWMQTHSAEVAGLDSSRPLLPQFDRLTDDQMRTAFRSIDPRAQENPGGVAK